MMSVAMPARFILLLLATSCFAQDWQPLFDGRTLNGWTGKDGAPFPSRYWKVEDGCLRTLPAEAGQDIFTARSFRDFELSLEWKVSPGGNSGVFYNLYDQPQSPRMIEWFTRPLKRWSLRFALAFVVLAGVRIAGRHNRIVRQFAIALLIVTLAAGLWAGARGWAIWKAIQGTANGLEMQVLDDERHPDAQRGPLYRAGALYDLVPAAPGAVKPAGEWNQARIIARGPHVEHWLNGTKVAEFELGSQHLLDRVAQSKFREVPGFGTKTTSPLALQHHHDAVWFRDIRVRPLGGEPTS